MPENVQRQVPSSWMNFFTFYVKVDSDREAASMEFHGSSEQYLAFTSCVLLEESHTFYVKVGDPRAGSHWKSGHYSHEQYGGVYGGLAVDGCFVVKCCIFPAPSVRTDCERHFSEPSMVKSSLPSRAPAQ